MDLHNPTYYHTLVSYGLASNFFFIYKFFSNSAIAEWHAMQVLLYELRTTNLFLL